jgi:putative ABC transport system substrate-binding protein
MDRRTAVGVVLSIALSTFRGVALSQPGVRVYRIGYANLRAGPAEPEEGFLQGLRDLGYADGTNLLIEYRWADNDIARNRAQIEELVRLKVDVLVTASTPAVRAAKRATTTIPIVFAGTSDPVGTGLVANLAHPGGNITGISLLSVDLARKRLQFLRELLPGTTRMAVLGCLVPESLTIPPEQRSTDRLVAETQAAAERMGVQVSPYIVTKAVELPTALAGMKRAGIEAVIVQSGSLVWEHRELILDAFSKGRFPAMYEARNYVDIGGLVSYGPDVRDAFRQAAGLVDKILRGANPGDLPVQQPDKFDLVINQRTAQALGVTIPQSLRTLAEVV